MKLLEISRKVVRSDEGYVVGERWELGPDDIEFVLGVLVGRANEGSKRAEKLWVALTAQRPV